MKKFLLTSILLLTATITFAASIPTTVSFMWDASPEPNVVLYKLYCSPTNVQPYTFVGSTNLTTITTTLDLGTFEYCAATASNDYGLESVYSNVVTLYPFLPPAAPKTVHKK